MEMKDLKYMIFGALVPLSAQANVSSLESRLPLGQEEIVSCFEIPKPETPFYGLPKHVNYRDESLTFFSEKNISYLGNEKDLSSFKNSYQDPFLELTFLKTQRKYWGIGKSSSRLSKAKRKK